MPRTFIPRPPRSSLADRAYDELKGLLQNSTFPPGMFLSERQLAERLRMSKTPVRSALVRLEMEGFVAISPQQGIVVRELSIQEIVDLFDIRIALETFVVRRLAGNLKPEQAVRLRENLKAQAAAVKQEDVEESTRRDTEFHTLLCDFLDNREIAQVMWRLRDKLHRVILRIQKRDPARMATSYREHESIAEAVTQGRGDQAAQRVTHHLEYGKRFLLDK